MKGPRLRIREEKGIRRREDLRSEGRGPISGRVRRETEVFEAGSGGSDGSPHRGNQTVE